MRSTLLLVLAATPVLAFAQQPQNQYSQFPQQAYPQQQAYPKQAYPQQAYPQQQQPYPQYPQQQSYPYYPPPPRPAPPPPPARLTLATRSMEVAQLVTACANAIDNYHLDVARKKCGEALAKEDTLAFTHYLLAQVEPPDVAHKELARAADLSKTAS